MSGWLGELVKNGKINNSKNGPKHGTQNQKAQKRGQPQKKREDKAQKEDLNKKLHENTKRGGNIYVKYIYIYI